MHATGVRQPLIRTEMVRYVQTITTTLRPYTVAGRTKALRVFFDYLADHHPEVTRLEQIERTRHIEPYLAWARTRPWRAGTAAPHHRRGRVPPGRDSNCPPLRRHRRLGLAMGAATATAIHTDVPRTPDALPRALTPDVDRALMTASPTSMTHSCVPACCCYTPPASASANCSTSNWTASDFARHGAWLRCRRQAELRRLVPLDRHRAGDRRLDRPTGPSVRCPPRDGGPN